MDLNDIEVIEPLTPVQEFYCNTNVFITGATGFLGRMLVEKLLRSCPDIVNIYLLVRKKCGRHPKDRLEVMLEDPMFACVKQKDANLTKKLVPLRGDCTLPYLGLKKEDRKILFENIPFQNLINEVSFFVGLIFNGDGSVLSSTIATTVWLCNSQAT
ncbi:hypothetical protein Trydic_g8596 [Trypoxylus dichotomus]